MEESTGDKGYVPRATILINLLSHHSMCGILWCYRNRRHQGGGLQDDMKRCLSIVKNEVRLEVPLPIVDLLACFAEAVGVNICRFHAADVAPLGHRILIGSRFATRRLHSSLSNFSAGRAMLGASARPMSPQRDAQWPLSLKQPVVYRLIAKLLSIVCRLRNI